MSRHAFKRQTDLQLLSEWIETGSRVLDLGCGRGVLLEQLRQTRQTYGVGVDTDLSKVQSCLKRGVNVYQGDAEEALAQFGDGAFDWVILSRTVQELERPAAVIEAALRVGRRLAVGFVNYGYWRNRWSILHTGSRIHNEVYPHRWHQGGTHNPVSVSDFESFLASEGLTAERVVYLRGDWITACRWLPNLRAGYALYAVTRPGKVLPTG